MASRREMVARRGLVETEPGVFRRSDGATFIADETWGEWESERFARNEADAGRRARVRREAMPAGPMCECCGATRHLERDSDGTWCVACLKIGPPPGLVADY